MTTIANLPDLVRGDDITYEVQIDDDQGVPIDIQGDSVYMTVKKAAADPDVLAVMQALVLIDAVDTDGSNGLTKMIFSGVATDIQARTYQYDIQWTRTASGNGDTLTIMLGKLTILQQVTATTVA